MRAITGKESARGKAPGELPSQFLPIPGPDGIGKTRIKSKVPLPPEHRSKRRGQFELSESSYLPPKGPNDNANKKENKTKWKLPKLGTKSGRPSLRSMCRPIGLLSLRNTVEIPK